RVLLCRSGLAGGLLHVLIIRFDRALQLDRQRIALAVAGLAGGDADPALAHAIFFDIGLLDPLEADADAAGEQIGVVIGAARIEREAIGRRVGLRRIGHGLFLMFRPAD